MMLRIISGETVTVPGGDVYPIKFLVSKNGGKSKNLDEDLLNESTTSTNPALKKLNFLRSE